MMIKLIRRGWLGMLFVLLAFVLSSFAPSDIQARGRHHGSTIKKASHSVTFNKRRAKLSHKNRPTRCTPLTANEKTEIIEKISSLATAEVTDGQSTVNAEDLQPDDIAQAAKEEQEEDDVDVSMDKFFSARIGDVTLDPAKARDRQSDFTLYDEFDPKLAATRSDVMQHIIDWLGTRYHYGGLSREGIDCSAFVREVYRKSFNVELPRTANMQSGIGDNINRTGLQFGDLVFFHTTGRAYVSHVGIYIGEGLFANSSCSKGVTVSSLESKYWAKRYIFAKRLFTNTATAQLEIEKKLKLAEQVIEDEAANLNAN